MAACQPRGSIILKSTVANDYTIDFAPLVINEISLIGSRCGRFEPAIRALAGGQINLKPLISSGYALSHFKTAFHKAGSGRTVKVIFDMKL